MFAKSCKFAKAEHLQSGIHWVPWCRRKMFWHGWLPRTGRECHLLDQPIQTLNSILIFVQLWVLCSVSSMLYISWGSTAFRSSSNMARAIWTDTPSAEAASPWRFWKFIRHLFEIEKPVRILFQAHLGSFCYRSRLLLNNIVCQTSLFGLHAPDPYKQLML